MKSPKTTVLGWIAFVSAAADAAYMYFDGDPLTSPNVMVVVTALTTALALTFAKDATPNP
jgi:hypothetical protein